MSFGLEKGFRNHKRTGIRKGHSFGGDLGQARRGTQGGRDEQGEQSRSRRKARESLTKTLKLHASEGKWDSVFSLKV